MAKPVSIIVLAHDRWDLTRRCLEAVRRTTRPGSYELLAYDNASSDGTFSRLRRLAVGWPELRPLRNAQNLSFARAVNRGMRAAAGRAVVWLNNDALPSPGWLDLLLAAADSDPSAAAAGPMTDHLAPPEQLAKPFSSSPATRAVEAPFLGGFCLLVKREAFERVGLLDERFVWGWEDMDYCLRLRQAGFKLLLCRSVFVRHDGSRTLGRMRRGRRERIDFQNRRLILRKWTNADPFRADLHGLFRGIRAPLERLHPTASIAVVSGGDWSRTSRCLAALRRCTLAKTREFLVADAGPRGEVSRRLERLEEGWPELKSLGWLAGRSWAGALNAARESARGDYFAVVSEDALVTPGWLSALIRSVETEPNIGAVGPLSAGPGLPRQSPRSDGAAGPSPEPVPNLGSFCLVFPRRALEQVGRFDERFSGRAAWADYTLRMLQSGFQLLVDRKVSVRWRERGEADFGRADAEDRQLLLSKWAGHPLLSTSLRR